jgi:tRNA threonylcarbamoyladenosine biosynthesis protein TsaB
LYSFVAVEVNYGSGVLMGPKRLLILETSGRRGQVALAHGATLLAARPLDEARRHARDLAPAIAELLASHHWKPRDIHAVIVSIGPGSYTGLRVGVMSAKTFAYATGCFLVGVETFAAVALQSPPDATRVDILADAQKTNIYVQAFTPAADGCCAASALTIQPFADWLKDRAADAWVSGPGLLKWRTLLPEEVRVVDEAHWEPRPESLLRLGLGRLEAGSTDNALSLEPLYLRPSSAEEQWGARGGVSC